MAAGLLAGAVSIASAAPPVRSFHPGIAPSESLAVHSSIPVGSSDSVVAVLLSGPIGSAYSWRHVEAGMTAKGYRVLIVDPLGMGASSRPRTADYALSTQAVRVQRLLHRSLSAHTRVVIAGLGTSATIAMHLAAIDSTRVAGVVSLAGGPVDRQGTRTVKIALALAPLLQTRVGLAMGRRRFTSTVRDQSADPSWFTDEIAAHYLQPIERDVRGQLQVLKDMHDAIEPYPIAQRLRQVVAPLRLLLGEKPTANAPTSEQVALMKQHIRRITIDTVRRAGTLMHEEQPSEVVRVLDEMLTHARTARRQLNATQLELDLQN